MTAPPALLKPSQLARFWELNPRTLHLWIREGRLPAIRSPGNHFRLRVADVRAFCEREGLPVPPFVSPPPRRVVVGAAAAPLRRALARSLKTATVLARVRRSLRGAGGRGVGAHRDLRAGRPAHSTSMAWPRRSRAQEHRRPRRRSSSSRSTCRAGPRRWPSRGPARPSRSSPRRRATSCRARSPTCSSGASPETERSEP